MEKNCGSPSGSMPWPYEVRYGQEERRTTDVLIIGGGLSGCFCAIHAARRGVKVAVMDKGAVIRSGAAGAGIDHWMMCAENPCSKIHADEMIEYWEKVEPFCSNHTMYICMRESYEALLDLEELGVKIRDTQGEFAGAPFRDPDTGLMFAYDYDNRHVVRIYGAHLKKALYRELRRLGVELMDYTMATSLLTEGGRQGARVVGATALNVRTGLFTLVNAKATVLAAAKPLRLWDWGSDKVGSNAAHDDPNCAGDGDAMAWRAGAKLTLMERAHQSIGSQRWPAYGVGNTANTWFPCTLVDAENREIPYVDRDGEVLPTVEARSRCKPGQRVMFANGTPSYAHALPGIPLELGQQIADGVYKLPLFADLSAMPEYERRAIFGLMIGNEGKTRVPVYQRLLAHGFDPARDMLMVTSNVPSLAGSRRPAWCACDPAVNDINVREMPFFYGGGLVVDWKHRTTLEGLYAIGNQVAGSEGASGAAANGRYCGRNVAEYVKTAALVPVCAAQAAEEKRRVLRPLGNTDGKRGWKEVQLGLCRLMQEYLGKYKSESTLRTGLWWFRELREHELSQVTVRNPHELARLLECEVRLTVGEVILYASMARRSSSQAMDFCRLDFPETIPWQEDCFLGIWQGGGKVRTDRMPLRYWLPEGRTYRQCYEENCGREEGG